jgi:hypothetical protein
MNFLTKPNFITLTNIDDKIAEGPTGAILLDLPSPYQPHPCGLLHLPRFLAKIRKHLEGELPASYQRNFTKGFDGFLCLHLGVEPAEIIECVKECSSESELDEKLAGLFPKDLKVHEWNRKVVQMGMSDMALDKLEEIKADLGAGQRQDLRSFADVIDFDEGKLK